MTQPEQPWPFDMQLADGLYISPHIPTWTEIHYECYRQGLRNGRLLDSMLGVDGTQQTIQHAANFSNTVPEYLDSVTSTLSDSLELLGAQQGIKPTQESIRQTERNVVVQVAVAKMMKLTLYSNGLAAFTGLSHEELPGRFNAIKYDKVLKQFEAELSIELNDFRNYCNPQMVDTDTILGIYPGMSTTIEASIDALVNTAILSGDREQLAKVQGIIDELQGQVKREASSRESGLKLELDKARNGVRSDVADYLRRMGRHAPNAIRHYLVEQNLSASRQFVDSLLKTKGKSGKFQEMCRTHRAAIAFICQPELIWAMGTMITGSPVEDEAPTEPGTAAAPLGEQVMATVTTSESSDAEAEPAVDIEAMIAAIVDKQVDVEFLREGDGTVLRETYNIRESMRRSLEKGHKLPSVDLSRLQMMSEMKQAWPGAWVERGLLTGRRKITAPDGQEAVSDYLALVMPQTNAQGEVIGEFVWCDSVVTGRNAGHLYWTVAGEGRSYQEALASKETAVDMPGVKLIIHKAVGSRTVTQTVREKLEYLLHCRTVEEYNNMTFRGETERGELAVRVGGMALRLWLEMNSTEE